MMKIYRKFGEDAKGSFPYWFNHWKAFNDFAREQKVWKVKYLFHDIEKPILNLIMPYEKVRALHRLNNRHHLAYLGSRGYDYDAMIIDWEVARYTKKAHNLNAIQTINRAYGMGKIKSQEVLKELVKSVNKIIKNYTICFPLNEGNWDRFPTKILDDQKFSPELQKFYFIKRDKDGRDITHGTSEIIRGDIITEEDVFKEFLK